VAVADCVEEYGGFIWALAKKFTGSVEEAEAATREIFTDIWRFSRRPEKTEVDEGTIIAEIARRRLLRYLQHDRSRKNSGIDRRFGSLLDRENALRTDGK
jgi:hypothetical protein